MALLLAVTAGGSLRRWERAMCAMVLVDLLLIPLAVLVHAGHPRVTAPTASRATADEAFLVVALVGTTAGPWQLFTQQSSVVDKRVTAR